MQISLVAAVLIAAPTKCVTQKTHLTTKLSRQFSSLLGFINFAAIRPSLLLRLLPAAKPMKPLSVTPSQIYFALNTMHLTENLTAVAPSLRYRESSKGGAMTNPAWAVRK
jgi:hypothetical protein